MPRLAALALLAAALPVGAQAACRTETAGGARLVVCDFHPAADDLRLFLNDAAGRPYGEFDLVKAALEAKGETLRFAMNAGMYHKNRTPVGLYVENGAELKKISTKDGPGNFHLLPNGVFWIDESGAAGVTETGAFALAFPSPACGSAVTNEAGSPPGGAPVSGARSSPAPRPLKREKAEGCLRYATQSGPMLVVDGAIHPKFLPEATSRKRRNGVGVRDDGAVVFAISDSAVTFHEFATFFRDTLKTPNALYLDGTISRLYAPDIARDEPGLPMGPIIGVVVKAE